MTSNRRARWAVVGAAVVATALIVLVLGVLATKAWFVGGDNDGSCRVTAEGLEHREGSRRLGVEVPPDQRPDAELGDRYSSLDGCVLGDDDLVG